MNKKVFVFFVAVCAIIIIAGVLSGRKVSGVPGSQTNTNTQANTATSGSSKNFTVTATDYSFSPSQLSLKKGDSVTVTLVNNGKFPHNLMASDLGVSSKTIAAGEKTDFTFTADKAGTFSFYCGVDSHKDKGMVGSFVVE